MPLMLDDGIPTWGCKTNESGSSYYLILRKNDCVRILKSSRTPPTKVGGPYATLQEAEKACFDFYAFPLVLPEVL